MVFSVLVAGALLVTWVSARRLPSGASFEPRADPRLRYVERHPDQVNFGDVCRLLGRELQPAEVRVVAERARALGIRPWTMYAWIKRSGVPSLAVAIAADLTHEELLLHLGEGTVPDVEQLGVFAAANGLTLAAAPPRSSRWRSGRPAAPRPALAARAPSSRPSAPPRSAVLPPARRAARTSTGPLPRIFEPGSWSFDAVPSDGTVVPGPAPDGSGGHGIVAA